MADVKKFVNLQEWIRSEERVIVAFSGGIDSTLLLLTASMVLGSDLLAVTAESASLPSRDRDYVTSFCKEQNISHQFIETDEFRNSAYLDNPENRCYICKKELFTKLAAITEERGYRSVLDGTNISDLSGHRPGLNAIREIPIVKTPYIELEITKNDIREMARELKLDISEKPSSACLSSRIPTGRKIRPEDLKLVDVAENLLRDYGFSQIRVRHLGETAKIETVEKEFSKALTMRKNIYSGLRKLGFKDIALSLRCYDEEV